MPPHASLTRLVALICLVAVALPAVARPRVAVLPFKNPPGFESEYAIGAGLAALVRQKLMAAGKVQVVERESLGDMKDELRLADDGHFDVSTIVPKGGFQGADFLVVGRVLDFGHFTKDTGLGALGRMAGGFTQSKTTAYVRLSVEVIDLRTGRLTFSDNSEAREERKGGMLLAGDIRKMMGAGLKIGSSEFDNSMIGRATHKALGTVVGKLQALFRLEARVLAVSPNGVVIDMGTTSGLQVGRKGRLFSRQEIRNSAGTLVWTSRRELGEVRVIEVQPEGALLQAPAGSTPKEGDTIDFDQ